MPLIAQSPEGKVISVWGTALIRGADGKLRLLKVGDIVRKGDQILTTQDGIVQIANGDGTVQAAQAKKPVTTPAGDEVERAIGERKNAARSKDSSCRPHRPSTACRTFSVADLSATARSSLHQ